MGDFLDECRGPVQHCHAKAITFQKAQRVSHQVAPHTSHQAVMVAAGAADVERARR